MMMMTTKSYPDVATAATATLVAQQQLRLLLLLSSVLLLLMHPSVVVGQTFLPCNICPNDGAVTNFFAPLDSSTGLTCGEAQLDAQAGLLDGPTCLQYQSQSILCGCTSTATTPSPTVAPTTSSPTFPPTLAPTQPFCNICGNDGFVGCNGVIGNSVCQEVCMFVFLCIIIT